MSAVETRYSYADLVLAVIKENGSITWTEVQDLITTTCNRLGLILPKDTELCTALTALEAAGKICKQQVSKGRRGRHSYTLWWAQQ